MEELKNNLAELVALEARFHDLVDPDGSIKAASLALLKSTAAGLLDLHAHLQAVGMPPVGQIVAVEPAEPEKLEVVVSQPTAQASEGIAHLEGEQVESVVQGDNASR